MKKLIVLCLLLLPALSLAAIDTYEFADEATRERFRQLTFELRCPKCQNQNLQDSNSPIAADLREEVYKMLQSGSDNDEIIDFMVARYGEFVLYKPPVNRMTYLLWYGPSVLVVLGLIIMVMVSRKRKKVSKEGVDLEEQLSAEESQRLKDILDGKRDD
ncbi:MAG: cytochrome c-type biogenesis protein CcmH [Neptuniibacter caesariensis]|uniref:Cytochrome c-type biogenesis protein n=1 Tax=Neptuniibacter caesariensis TaxID=207954 RepID=A0A2G6JM89_NEPCE|nr:MAG: cytochrome c-type biogenesis protein CcmH [Neptuniibacter caesariensis]